MLVASTRRPAPPPACADETEHRMVVRKRRNCRRSAATRALLDGRRWNEPPSPPSNARELAPLNQAPDGRTRDAERTPRLLNCHHCVCHARIVSQQSHRLNRLMTHLKIVDCLIDFHGGNSMRRRMCSNRGSERTQSQSGSTFKSISSLARSHPTCSHPVLHRSCKDRAAVSTQAWRRVAPGSTQEQVRPDELLPVHPEREAKPWSSRGNSK